ncbi:MAG: ABC transporter permease [Thermomicrobiales bacterium]
MNSLTAMTGRLLQRGLTGTASLLLGVAIFELIQPLVADSLGGPEGPLVFLERLPPAFQALLQTRPEFIMASGLAGYLSLGFTHPLFYILIFTAVVAFITRSLAGEMERGTIQIALSRPISRLRVYAARVAGALAIIAAIAAIGPLGMMAGIALARPEGTIEYRYLITTSVAMALLIWAVAGLTLLGSAAASTAGRAVGWAAAWLIVFYFVDYFAALWSVLEPLEPLSIFTYYEPAEAMVNGTLPVENVAILSLLGLGGMIGGLVVFVRRDLPV